MRVNLPALRRALATIEAHASLLNASLRDMLTEAGWEQHRDSVLHASTAIRHVLDDDFRSDETRGGS